MIINSPSFLFAVEERTPKSMINRKYIDQIDYEIFSWSDSMILIRKNRLPII